MKLANLEIVRRLKPRLGFGLPEEPRVEANLTPEPEPAPQIAPEPPQAPRVERLDPGQTSLVRLAEQLEASLKEGPSESRTNAAQGGQRLLEAFSSNAEEAEATQEQVEDISLRSLKGRKIAAIGFGRQDIAGIASGMMERHAQVQFIPRGVKQSYADFDVLVLNGASIESLKREVDQFRTLLESGTPSIVIGSRATLNLLKDCGDPRTWDFIAKPVHMDELAWRAENLLARQVDATPTRRLPARVVVADHDAFTRTLVESALTQIGIACFSADEGDAAWSAIEKSEPGAVILDLTLPNRDGFQLMADIRRSPGRKPKIIVLSARQSEADILRAFSLGADDYITKPFSPLELSARITRLLGSARSNALGKTIAVPSQPPAEVPPDNA